MDAQERAILKEFLVLYRNLPCLWDVQSDLYRIKHEKDQAWELLAEKLRELDPDTDVAQAKKKIENMRTACKREIRKIEEAKGTEIGVHVPILWYFDILNPILRKKYEEQQHSQASQRKKIKTEHVTEHEYQRQPIETEPKVTNEKKNSNSFALYVGEQLEQIDTFQRNVAEKLISDVLFLAKTGNLGLDTKIETAKSDLCRQLLVDNSLSYSPSPHYIIPSPSSQYSHTSSSIVYQSPHSVLPSSSKKYMQTSESDDTEYEISSAPMQIKEEELDIPSDSVLRGLLIEKQTKS